MLRIWITVQFAPVVLSFLLYNTHSLPVKSQDSFVTPFRLRGERFPDRWPEPAHIGNFALAYPLEAKDPVTTSQFWLTKHIFKYQIPFRTCQPVHPLQDAWTAPFFFEDSRHVFYVTTTTKQPVSSAFGVSVQAEELSL